MNYFTESFIHFYKELKLNNNKDWFNAHKAEYLEFIEQPFNTFISDLLEHIYPLDAEISMTSKQAIFRIHKDMRFYKGNAPYKLHSSALISYGQKKTKKAPSFYIELSSDEVKFGLGIYSLSSSKKKAAFMLMQTIQLSDEFKRVFTLQENPNAIIFETKLPIKVALSDNFMTICIQHWKYSQELNQKLKSAKLC